MSISLPALTLRANDTSNVEWFRHNGQPVGGLGNTMTVQLVGPVAWATAKYKVVARVNVIAPPILVPYLIVLSPSVPYAAQFDITSLWDIGLQLATAEGSELELTAYASIGVSTWPSA